MPESLKINMKIIDTMSCTELLIQCKDKMIINGEKYHNTCHDLS